MRAIGVNVHGGPDALEVLDLPEPHAGPGQIRIRVAAAAVNPTDTLQRSIRRQEVGPPWVPGMDIAGTVDEVGDGADDLLSVGDEAMAIVVPAGTHGAYAEYVVVPSGSAVPLPDGVDVVAASTLPMNGLTARLALDTLEIPAGGTLAVTGAAGAFGGYVVQLAVADGLRVVADAKDADEDLVRSLGDHSADARSGRPSLLVLPRGDGFAAAVRDVVPSGVDGLADGSVQLDALLPAVRDGGRIATVRGHDGASERGITWHPVWVRTIAEHRDKLDALRALASVGGLTRGSRAPSLPRRRRTRTARWKQAGCAAGPC